MAQTTISPIGTVIGLSGRALIRGTDGKMRVLAIGDVVHRGDQILTSPDGIVEISPAADAQDAEAQEKALRASRIDTPTIERIVNSLERGLAEEAPAAGLDGGGSGAPQPGLRVERIVENLGALAFGGAAAVEAPPPVPRGDTATADATGVPTLSVVSGSIGASERGAPVNLGLAQPSGSGPFTVSITQVPALGQVVTASGVVVTAGSVIAAANLPGLTYVPPANVPVGTPPASFGYVVSGARGSSATGTVAINLTAINDLPLATAARASGAEDTLVPVSLAGNDPDGRVTGLTPTAIPPGATLLLADGVTPVAPGTVLTPAQAATLLLRPPANFNGPMTLTFTVTDNEGGVSAPATVDVNVTAVNDMPVAATTLAGSGPQGSPIGITLAGSDVDGTVVAVTIVGLPANGTLYLADGVTPVTAGQLLTPAVAAALVFVPNPGFRGTSAIGYSVTDDAGAVSATTQASITVTPLARPPVAANDTASTAEDTPLTLAPAALLGNDRDPDGDALSVVGVQGAVNGSVALVGGNVVFTPAANYHGPASFTYTISDGNGGASTATVNVTVTPVNDAPVAVDNTATLAEDTPLTLTAAALLGNDIDPDGNPLTISSVQGAVNGTVALVAGNVVFTPAANYSGPASFTYTVSDGNGGTATATVNLTVTPVNDPPVAVNNTASTAEDTPLTLAPAALLGNDSDPEGHPLTITSVQGAVNGTVALVGGNVVFTPAANYNGPASFTYTVSDGNGGTATATVDLTVTAVNDAPVAVNDAATTAEDTPLTLTPAALLGNDTDVDGNPLTITSVQGAVNGTVALVAGNVVFTPALDYTGPASFTYTVSDGNGGTATATMNVTVGPVNDPPVAVNDTATTAEDTPLTLAPSVLLANDSDRDGNPLSIVSVQGAVNGTAALVAGNVVFTPAPNYNGPASFTYTISDGVGSTATATVNLTVTPVNDPPVALDDAANTAEDTPLTLTSAALLGNDSDAEGHPLTITSVQGAVNGTVALLGGNVVFTPAAHYNGPASFTYTISDGNGGTATATVNLTVTPVNDPPVAVNDTATTTEDTPLTLTPSALLANDTDVDGNPLTITSVQGAINGAVALVAGNVVFTPASNYNGPASFTYTVSDGNGGTATATVNLTVTPVNDPPVAVNDTASTAEDTPLTLAPSALLANDTDPDGNPLTITSVQGAVNGTVALVAGNVVFTPAANFNGPASFTYTISDGNGSTATATVNLTVTPVNDPPVAINDTATTTEDTPLTLLPAALLGNDTDVDGNPLTITSVQGAVNGTVALVAGNVVFTPASNYNGPASFTYTVSDGNGGTATATVNLTVSPVNDPPVAVNDTASTAEDTPLTLAPTALLGNDTDPDGNPLAITSVQGAVNGAVALVAGNVVFTPAANYNGPASFTYTISDGNGGTSTATVNLTVSPVNDPPVAVNDAATTAEDTPLTLAPAALLGNDTDADGHPLTITSVQGAVNGTVALVGGNVVFTPTANYNGPASFTYTISDGNGGTSTATVNLTVTPVNDPPVAVNDTATTAEDTPLTLTPAALLANDRDVDGNPLTITSVQGAVNGAVALVAGNVVFTPAANYNGPASFTYTISDGNGGTSTATVNLTVTPVNDVPVNTVPPAQTTGEDTRLVFSSATGNPITVADTDGGTLTTTLTVTNGVLALGSLAGVTVTGNGSASVQVTGSAAAINAALNGAAFTPRADFAGSASLTVTTGDGTATDIDSVAITIAPIADAPTLYAHLSAPVAASSATIFTDNFNDNNFSTPAWTRIRLDLNTFAADPTSGRTQTEAALFGDVAWQGQTSTAEWDNTFWTVNGGVLNYNLGGGGGSDDAQGMLAYQNLSAANRALTSYSVSADLNGNTGSEQNNGVGLVFGYQNANNYFLARWENMGTTYLPGGSQFNGYPGQANQLSIVQMVGGVPIDLGVFSGFTTPGTFNLRIEVSAVGIQLFVNNGTAAFNGSTAQVSYTYGSVPGATTAPPALNTIGVYTFDNDSGVSFDNVRVDTLAYRYTLDLRAYQNDPDGSESLSPVTLSNLPAGITLAGSGGPIAIVGGSATVAVTSGVDSLLTLTSSTPLTNTTINAIQASVTSTEAGGGSASTSVPVLPEILGTGGANTLTGSAASEWIEGRAGNDTISAGAGNDVILGGAGNDTLTSGAGVDVFKWSLADRGSPGAAASDTVTDFNNAAGGDVLDLRDLLVGENSANLANYLHFTTSGGSTTISVSTTGGFAGGFAAGAVDQVIQIAGVNLVGGLGGDAQVIADLLGRGRLVTDGP